MLKIAHKCTFPKYIKSLPRFNFSLPKPKKLKA